MGRWAGVVCGWGAAPGMPSGEGVQGGERVTVFTSAMLFFAFFLYRFCTKKRICAKSTLENWTCGAAPGGQRAATGCTTRARNAAMGVPTIVLSRESRGGSRRARPPCARGRSAACQTSQLNLPPAACRQPPLAEHKCLRPNTTTTTEERAPRALPWAAAEDQRRARMALRTHHKGKLSLRSHHKGRGKQESSTKGSRQW